jgi:hypothetical protein
VKRENAAAQELAVAHSSRITHHASFDLLVGQITV